MADIGLKFNINLEEEDIKQIKEFVESDDFGTFVLDNANTLEQAAFILQTLIDACDRLDTFF